MNDTYLPGKLQAPTKLQHHWRQLDNRCIGLSTLSTGCRHEEKAGSARYNW